MSLFVGLQNNEFIVYNEAQCTVRYIMEVSGTNTKELEFNTNRDVLRNALRPAVKEVVNNEKEISVTIDTSKLKGKAKTEMEKFFGSGTFPFIYNAKSETFDFGQASLTQDDVRFLSREIKKCFAESDKQWRELLNTKKNIKAIPVKRVKKNEEISAER